MTNKQSGLAGVIAGESAIATVGQSGQGLNYRGYSIDDLANQASFEEVAYLLHYGTLPDIATLQSYQKRLQSKRHLPDEIKSLLKTIPKNTHPMDMLRTSCSYLGNLEPEETFEQQVDIADRLLALYPAIICYWYHWHYTQTEISEYSEQPTIGGHFLALLLQKPVDEMAIQMMNVSLILYAEHEFNASTFAARVTAATLSDIYSAMTSAIGALRGPLHGGANEAAMALIERFSSADEAEKSIMQMLVDKEKIMGFGHRVYTESDPRSDIIKAWSKKLARSEAQMTMYEVSERIESVMWREKKLFPNLDFYSASAYHFCQIPTFLFTPVFVMSRTTGWAAHVFEQRENNRLIRPASEYTGPEQQTFIPIDQRG